MLHVNDDLFTQGLHARFEASGSQVGAGLLRCTFPTCCVVNVNAVLFHWQFALLKETRMVLELVSDKTARSRPLTFLVILFV